MSSGIVVASMLYLPSPDTMFDVEFEGTSGSSACCLTGGIRRIRRLFSIALNNDVLDLLPLIFTRSSLADAISTFLCEVPAILPSLLPGIEDATFRRVP